MNTITRGMRNAFRNGIRTISITSILSLSIALALAMVLARGAVEAKITSVKSSVGTAVTITPAGTSGFEGGGEPLTQSQVSPVASLDHVTNVTYELRDRLNSDNTNLQSAIDAGTLGNRFRGQNNSDSGDDSNMHGNGSGTRAFSIPVTFSATTDLAGSVAAQNGQLKMVSGSVFTVDSSEQVALIGKNVATKNTLSVGSTFIAYGQTIKVAGIYDSGNTFSNGQILMPLKTLQMLSGQSGQVSSATVTIDSVTNVSTAANAIKSTLGSAADISSQQDQAEAALAPLENVKTITLISLIGAVIAGSVIVLLTMVMIVRERRREIGVLKAIGASNVKVISQFMAEAVTFTLMAAAIGILLGMAGGNPITKALVSNSQSNSSTSQAAGPEEGTRVRGGQGGRRAFMQTPTGNPERLGRRGGLNRQNLSAITTVVGWSTLLYGLGAAIVIALVGSAAASFIIAKVRPAEVMRAE